MKTGIIGVLAVVLLAGIVAAVGYRQHVRSQEQQQENEARSDAAQEQQLKALTVKKFSDGQTLSPVESEELRQLTEWKAKREIERRGK